MNLTQRDIRIIKWAFEYVENDTFNNPSGDLYDEERYEMRLALKNLPKISTLPKGAKTPRPENEKFGHETVRDSDIAAYKKWCGEKRATDGPLAYRHICTPKKD